VNASHNTPENAAITKRRLPLSALYALAVAPCRGARKARPNDGEERGI
jgi:hypothetical protein